MPASFDLTRLTAHALAERLRAGETTSREHHGGAPRPGPRDRSRPPRLADDRRRAGAGRGRRGGRPARGGARRWPGGGRRAPPAARHPGRAQGPRLGRGRPGHRGFADPRGLPLAVRRPHHRAAARRRRRDPGQDQHGRVRDGLVDRALGVRPDGQPVGPRAGAGRIQRRVGGGGGRVPRAARRSGRTPAARSASRRRCAASSGSSRPTAGSAATGSWPSPAASTRSGRSPATPATPRRSCTRSPGATTRDSTSAPIDGPGRPDPAPGIRRRGGVLAARPAVRAAEGVLPRRAWSRASRRGSARPSRPSRRRARRSRRSASRTRTTAWPRTTSSRPPRRRPTSPATTASASACSVRGGDDYLANYLATRGQGFGAEVKRRIMLGHLRAVRRLLRRVLPQGAEGPDADQARLRPPVGAGVRRPRRTDLGHRRVPVRRADGGPGLDVPVRRLHAAGEHGRAARRVRSRAACPTACRSGSS